MVVPPELKMDWQARLPAALAALHNFIHRLDNIDIEDVEDPEPGAREGELAFGMPGVEERARASKRHDKIAQDMWDQYVSYHAARI